MQRLALFSNPRSRQNRIDPALRTTLEGMLLPDDVSWQTVEATDLEALPARILREEIGILAILGGDGTFHLALTSLLKALEPSQLPDILLLRGGTMNTVARGLRLNAPPRALLQRVQERRVAGALIPFLERRPLWVKDGLREHGGFLFGTGLIAHFLEEYYRTPDVSPLVAAKTLGRAVWSVLAGGALADRLFRKTRMRLDGADGLWWEGEAQALLASTVEELGLGFRPFFEASLDLDAFHAAIVMDASPGLVTALPSLWFGRRPRTPIWRDARMQRLRASGDALPYTLDGELYEAQGEITLSLAAPLRLLRP